MDDGKFYVVQKTKELTWDFTATFFQYIAFKYIFEFNIHDTLYQFYKKVLNASQSSFFFFLIILSTSLSSCSSS